jgi:hypothetical protein
MATEKATYWMAVAVMGLLLGNSVAARQQGWFDLASRQVLGAAHQVAGEATTHMDAAITAMNYSGVRPMLAEAVLVHAQSRLAAVQGKLACKEAVFARVQALRQREMALAQVRQAMRACPRQSLQVKVAAN